ncbi:MAG: hypothetical protein Kow0042_05190 [Calditrichia bacterium]
MKTFLPILTLLLLIGLVMGQPSWNVIMGPQVPELYSRDNVFFLNENEGWIVGTISSVSVVLHTTDGGQTWTVQYNDSTDFSMYNIGFFNSNVGWIVGSKGVIWNSIDGGNTWNDQTPGITTKSLNGIGIVDANTVYVSGDDGTMLKTTDGGATWVDQTIASLSSSDLDIVYAFNANQVLTISNSNDGMAAYTSDGGTTWNTTSLPYPPGGISQRTYCCTGEPGGTAYAGGYHGNVFKTTDYGQTWTNVATFWPALFKYLPAITMSGTDHVWTGSYNYLFHSTDGGATWDTLSYPSANNLQYLKAFNSTYLYSFATYGQFFESTDGGQNWTALFSWPNISFWDMVATSNKIFAGAIYAGEITTSTDDGLTWSYPLTPMEGMYDGINDMFFYDDNLGFFTGGDGIIGKTTDGGQTWEIKANSYGFGSNKTYNFIYFKDALNGYAGGSSGIIQYSTDGGETWTEGSVGTSATLYDCIFLDTNTGIIAASSGRIYRTTDGGASWTEVVDMGTMTMRNIYFLDATTGFICASSGYLFKTTDAGANWTQVTQLTNMNAPGDDPDLYRIHFVNATKGYICGEDGAVYETTDGGTTWTQLTVPTEIHWWTLQAMAWLDETKGLIAGQNGYILGTGITNISSSEPIADDYVLYQNYPNPFNPETTIGFNLPRHEQVSVVIYNTLGQVVRVLYSGDLNAGYHTLKWDGNNQFGLASPSGLYFYQLTAGDYSQVNKMVLMR